MRKRSNDRKKRGRRKIDGPNIYLALQIIYDILTNGFGGQRQKQLSWEPESHRQ